MQVGIDQIGLFTPDKYVDMVDLANARKQDPNKFLVGIGQREMSVADIARTVGYEDSQYFFRVFKKATGQTPLQYRQQHRKQE